MKQPNLSLGEFSPELIETDMDQEGSEIIDFSKIIYEEDIRENTIYENSSKINYRELKESIEENVKNATDRLSYAIGTLQESALKQVEEKDIIRGKNYKSVRDIILDPKFLKDILLNSFIYIYLEGKHSAKINIENAIGKTLTFASITDITPTEALNAFSKKIPISKSEFGILVAKEKAKAFTVAGIIEKDLLRQIHFITFKAIDQGWTIPRYQSEVRKSGIKYTGSVYGKIRTGEFVNPVHAETIIRTGFADVYNRGRDSIFRDPDIRDYVKALQYSAVMDSRTRESHAAMDGKIYPIDDPIWDSWTPPNGYNCFIENTKISIYSKRDVKIEDVKHGDLVYTHIGNWKPVIELHKNWYEGNLISIKLENNYEISCTPNHLIMTKRGWISANEIKLDDTIITRNSISAKKQWENNPERRKQQSEFGKLKLASKKDVPKKWFPGREKCCLQCGKLLENDFYDYCGNKCVNKSNSNKFSFSTFGLESKHVERKLLRTIDFEELKETILERDNYTCKLCDSNNRLQVHHIDFDQTNSDPENLITLCISCHGKASIKRDEFFIACSLSLQNEFHICQNPGIKIIPFSGYVYNLGVQDDESYCANGIVVHNCRCIVVPVTSNEKWKASEKTKLKPDPGFGDDEEYGVSEENGKIKPKFPPNYLNDEDEKIIKDTVKKVPKVTQIEDKNKLSEILNIREKLRTEMLRDAGFSEISIKEYGKTFLDWVKDCNNPGGIKIAMLDNLSSGKSIEYGFPDYVKELKDYKDALKTVITDNEIRLHTISKKYEQEILRKDFGNTVTVFRGVDENSKTTKFIREKSIEEAEIPFRNISSFSSSPEVTKTYSSVGGIILETTIPVESVVSTYLTNPHIHSLWESEFIISSKELKNLRCKVYDVSKTGKSEFDDLIKRKESTRKYEESKELIEIPSPDEEKGEDNWLHSIKISKHEENEEVIDIKDLIDSEKVSMDK